MTREPDERMRQAAQHAENIRAAVDKFVAEDVVEAARIRKASDKTLAVADETHKHPLPLLSQVRSWTGAHLDETRQRMIDAVKIWRNAGVAQEHALDMYDVAVEADRNEKAVDTAGLREVADDLREHASRMATFDQYDNEGLFASVFACNEAIARINEKNTTIAARLNAAANQITEAAAEWDMAPADRPRVARARPR